jgi:hypothetical protein
VSLPIRIRLTAVYCAAFLAVIVLLASATYASVRAAVHTIVDHELASRLAGLEGHLTRHVGRLSWSELTSSLQTHQAFQPELLRIAESGGATLFQGSALGDLSRLTYQEVPSIETLRAMGETVGVMSLRRTI